MKTELVGGLAFRKNTLGWLHRCTQCNITVVNGERGVFVNIDGSLSSNELSVLAAWVDSLVVGSQVNAVHDPAEPA